MRETKSMNNSTPDEIDDFDVDQYIKTHLPEYDEYVGKHLVISLTYLEPAGEVGLKVQIHGVIKRINNAIIAVSRQDTGEEFTIPTDMEALQPAPEGEYRLRPSGEVVVNPDYLTVWTVGGPSAESG